MCAAREAKNVWWYLFSKWPNYAGKGPRWRGWDLFHRRWWRNSEYLYHDSFGKFWNRWVKCKLTGHHKVMDVACNGEPQRLNCFDCEQAVTENIKNYL